MPVTLEEEKSLLRRRVMELRSAISPAQKYLWENAIARRVLTLPEYQQARWVLAYLSTPTEIDTSVIIAHALMVGKGVAVPRCGPEKGRMEFCPLVHHRELTDRFHGIPQHPPESAALSAEELSGAFCVVPALAVSPQGHRLGYGGGYYDRFLVQFSGTSAVLTYDWSLTEKVRPGPQDVAVNLVVTPDQVLRPGVSSPSHVGPAQSWR